LLAIVIAPAAMINAAVFHGAISPTALTAAGIAGGICWSAAVLGLTCTWLGNVLHSPVQGLLGGMLFRMGLPLVAIMALLQSGGQFGAAGLTGTILGVYLVTLVVETALAVRMVPPEARTARATS
jgi:hypothetical protein